MSGLKKTVLAAMFLAIGVVLPLFTGQIKEIGNMLLPMHIPVMLCGLVCGAQYGLAIGFILPFLRSVSFSVPPLYPNAVWMAFELATYGFVIGLLYFKRENKGVKYLYFCLILSMISGRVVWGVVKAILFGLGGNVLTLKAFITGGLLNAIPGIILQLVLIPCIIALINKKQ